MTDFALVVAVSGTAALASLAGGWLSLHRKPTTLFLSLTLGTAGGVLLGVLAFEMIPQAMELSSTTLTVAGIGAGVLAVYSFELLVMRGKTSGIHANQRRQIRHYHRLNPPVGDEVTVLAGGTTAEELIEGLSIGVGAAIQPGLALIVGISIALDNVAEALSIGALIAEKDHGPELSAAARRRVLKWTGAIAVGLFLSSVLSWAALRSLPDAALGFLVAVGAGGMFYLCVTELVPEAELRHYQHTSALAAAVGFMVILVLSTW